MSKPMSPTSSVPKIRQFMTPTPVTIDVDTTLSQAGALMREHQFRHLPVLREEGLVGMLSQRDLHLIQTLKDIDPEQVTVEDAMSTEVYQVAPDCALDEVAAAMAEHKYGSAVVVQDGKVVGIFTVVDALKALVAVLQTPATR